jgi:hypothetical protein
MIPADTEITLEIPCHPAESLIHMILMVIRRKPDRYFLMGLIRIEAVQHPNIV